MESLVFFCGLKIGYLRKKLFELFTSIARVTISMVDLTIKAADKSLNLALLPN